jgi:DNA anti-recombination protein RmuC
LQLMVHTVACRGCISTCLSMQQTAAGKLEAELRKLSADGAAAKAQSAEEVERSLAAARHDLGSQMDELRKQVLQEVQAEVASAKEGAQEADGKMAKMRWALG